MGAVACQWWPCWACRVACTVFVTHWQCMHSNRHVDHQQVHPLAVLSATWLTLWGLRRLLDNGSCRVVCRDCVGCCCMVAALGLTRGLEGVLGDLPQCYCVACRVCPGICNGSACTATGSLTSSLLVPAYAPLSCFQTALTSFTRPCVCNQGCCSWHHVVCVTLCC